jgi:hypothetical protein
MEKQEIITYKPPTVAELFEEGDNIELAYKNDMFNQLLNTPPKKEWVKKHPTVANWNYLPIDKVEFLLKKIFTKYHVEIKQVQPLFNAVQVTVRLHYFNPILGVMEYQDGVGAEALQLNSGSNASDLNSIKKGAVTIATPIAEVHAIKDAAEKIGDIFGGNLNRKDVTPFVGDANIKTSYVSAEQKRRAELIEACTDIKQLEKLREDAMGYDLMEQYSQKYAELQ